MKARPVSESTLRIGMRHAPEGHPLVQEESGETMRRCFKTYYGRNHALVRHLAHLNDSRKLAHAVRAKETGTRIQQLGT